jgi:hypothetical protein
MPGLVTRRGLIENQGAFDLPSNRVISISYICRSSCQKRISLTVRVTMLRSQNGSMYYWLPSNLFRAYRFQLGAQENLGFRGWKLARLVMYVNLQTLKPL